MMPRLNLFKTYAPLIYGCTDGLISAAEAALTGAIGGLVLNEFGYTYDVTDIAKAVALGKAISAICVSATTHSLATCGFFRRNFSRDVFSFHNAFLLTAHISFQVMSGVIGQVLINFFAAEKSSQMEVAKVTALGAVILLIPIWVLDKKLYKNINGMLEQLATKFKIIDILQSNQEGYSEKNLVELQKILRRAK
jgi:hypothetical protein